MFHFPYDIILMRKDIHQRLMSRYRLKVRLAPFLGPFDVNYSSNSTSPSSSPTRSDTPSSTVGSFDASTSTSSFTSDFAADTTINTIPSTPATNANNSNFPCPLPLYSLPHHTSYSVSPILRFRSISNTQHPLSRHGLRKRIPNPFALSMQMYQSTKQPYTYCVKSISLGADGTVKCERVVNEADFTLAKDLWAKFSHLRTGVEWASRAQAVSVDDIESAGADGEYKGKSGLSTPFETPASTESALRKEEEEEELERKRALSCDGAGGGGWSNLPGPKDFGVGLGVGREGVVRVRGQAVGERARARTRSMKDPL
jgi:hypothetical protein